jgi:hypothetical protein
MRESRDREEEFLEDRINRIRRIFRGLSILQHSNRNCRRLEYVLRLPSLRNSGRGRLIL